MFGLLSSILIRSICVGSRKKIGWKVEYNTLHLRTYNLEEFQIPCPERTRFGKSVVENEKK